MLTTALANARVFDSYELACEDAGEAGDLASLFRSVGDCGVGVSSVPRRGPRVELLPARRRGEPDLQPRHLGVLWGMFDGCSNNSEGNAVYNSHALSRPEGTGNDINILSDKKL